MTDRNTISNWFDKGVEAEQSHMIIMCDTFDHEDYPMYCKTPEDTLRKYDSVAHGSDRVMEVYDLNRSRGAQLEEYRAFNLPLRIREFDNG